MLRRIADIITDVDDMLESAMGKEYFDAATERARQMPMFVKALQSTKKYGDVKNAGAAVWLMTRSALREFGEDDGMAYTPIMKLFGRAAIPETTAKGVKALIDRKMKSGEISSPWEIFENMLGDKPYGTSGRKTD